MPALSPMTPFAYIFFSVCLSLLSFSVYSLNFNSLSICLYLHSFSGCLSLNSLSDNLFLCSLSSPLFPFSLLSRLLFLHSPCLNPIRLFSLYIVCVSIFPSIQGIRQNEQGWGGGVRGGWGGGVRGGGGGEGDLWIITPQLEEGPGILFGTVCSEAMM